MARSNWSRWCACVVALVASHCVSPPSPMQAAQLCGDGATASCGRLQRCEPSHFASTYVSMEECVATTTTSCVPDLESRTTGWTPTTYAACSAAIAAESCDDFLAGAPLAACPHVSGHASDGDSCQFNSQCHSTFCAESVGATCGTCQPLSTQGSGCPCSAGFTCVHGVCATLVPPSSACDGVTSVCTEGDCVMGHCQAYGATAGATCDLAHATAPRCDGRFFLHCDSATHACALNTVVATGAACGYLTGGGYGECAAGFYCARNTAGAFVCTARIAGGGTCDPTASTTGCVLETQCEYDVAGDSASCVPRGQTACMPVTQATDDCAATTDCGECTSQGSCGWCPGSGVCRTTNADNSGSADGTCAGDNWDFFGDTC